MRTLVIAAGLTAGLMFTTSASAADMFPAASILYSPVSGQSWAGPYAGISAGAIYNKVSHNDDYPGTPDQWDRYQVAGASGFGSFNIGYNFQWSDFVYGVEADYGLTDVASSYGWDYTTYTGRAGERLTSLGTVRGRLGYSIGNSLLYLTGGFAYGRVKHTFEESDTDVYNYSVSGFQTGWTAGAGYELALTGNIALTGQFLYADLGTKTISTDGGGGVYQLDNDVYVATIGLKYRFSGAPAGLLK